MKLLLQVHSLSISFLLALGISIVLSVHVVMAPVLPIADGEGYALRAFALYGYLHTGQWHDFWSLLDRPGQSILPLHYPLFLILPAPLAGVASYVVLQNVITYLLLAYAVFKASQVLNRPEWAPSIFLLCSLNNIAWIDFYAFFLDMQFFALGLLVIAFQMMAWKENRPRLSLLSGVGLGLLFMVKPANAVIFLTVYFMSEACYWIWSLRSGRARRDLLKDIGYKQLGFIPVLGAAVICGAAQSVLQLIDQNEIHEVVTPLACTGLLRLFYFPLCLSAYYHALLLGGLLLVAMLSGRWIPGAKVEDAAPSFPCRLLVSLLISYLIFAEFFSFWMSVKPMRAMLLLLPLCWFVFYRLWERRRLPLEPLVLAVAAYGALLLGQKEFDLVGTRDQFVEDNYQLAASSWMEMPSAWHRGASLNRIICDGIERDLPSSGIICVNSIEIRNALAWRLGSGPLLLGNVPSYQVRNLFDYRGRYFDQALDGANVVALITFFPVQSTRSSWLESMGILNYGNEVWCGPGGSAKVRALPAIRGDPIGYEFIFPRPLGPTDVETANKSSPFAGMARANHPRALDSIYGRHYSRAEAWQLLETWFERRLW